MNKLLPTRHFSDGSAAPAAREKNFPSWQRVCAVVILGIGMALLVLSAMFRAAADVLYMSGLTLVVLDVLAVAGLLVYLPARAIPGQRAELPLASRINHS